MTHGFFVTGTDTGVGKTRVSLELMRLLQSQGHVVTGMKPVASGCSGGPSGLENDDALQLQSQASFTLPYSVVNPYAFEPPIAPHIAAEVTETRIQLERIKSAFTELTAEADRAVVEGVGGWLVPIDSSQTMADVAIMLQLPVILVVGIRLGCLNHALMSAAAIADSGLPMAGWVANRVDPDCLEQTAIIESIRERLAVPCLGDLPWLAEGECWSGELALPAS